MKRKSFFLSLMLTALAIAVTFSSCEREKDPTELKLVALVAGDIDLNAAISATSVPTSPTITATFNTDVDPATATAANITLSQNHDNADIELEITVSGKVITITPVAVLGTGNLFDLRFLAGLKSTEGLALIPVSRNFTTAGTFAPAGVIAHWKFEDNANDVTGNFNAAPGGIVDITYIASRNADAGKAANFNGTTSIIEIPNADQLINTRKFTISFWVRAVPQDKGHFVLGLGAFYGIQFEIFGGLDGAKFAVRYVLEDDTTTVAEDMWFPSDATHAGTGGWQGWDFAKPIPAAEYIAMVSNQWLHVVYTFNGETRRGILYYNGEKMKSLDFNLWPDGTPQRTVKGMKWAGRTPDVVNELAFGFIQSRAGTMWDTEPWGGYDFPGANHFKGQLDDVRIFHKDLTPIEIQLMFNSEKP